MRERWTAILALIEPLGRVNLLKVPPPQRGPLWGHIGNEWHDDDDLGPWSQYRPPSGEWTYRGREP